jgi:hypothetical protein
VCEHRRSGTVEQFGVFTDERTGGRGHLVVAELREIVAAVGEEAEDGLRPRVTGIDAERPSQNLTRVRTVIVTTPTSVTTSRRGSNAQATIADI